MMCCYQAPLQLLLVVLLLRLCQGIIQSDGLCPLFIFTPFTIASEKPSGTLSGKDENITNKGFSQMSAALLAMEHFNARNGSVVPDLANYTDCSIKFDTNTSRVLDTGSITHLAAESLWQQDVVPCAIAGPFNDVPAIDLSVMALSAKIPLVAHRAHNLRITSDYLSPYSSQTYPGSLSSAHKVVEFLLHKGRSDYIGVLYSLTETGIQRQEAMAVELDHYRLSWMSAGYSFEHEHHGEEECTEGGEQCDTDKHHDENHHDHGRRTQIGSETTSRGGGEEDNLFEHTGPESECIECLVHGGDEEDASESCSTVCSAAFAAADQAPKKVCITCLSLPDLGRVDCEATCAEAFPASEDEHEAAESNCIACIASGTEPCEGLCSMAFGYEAEHDEHDESEQNDESEHATDSHDDSHDDHSHGEGESSEDEDWHDDRHADEHSVLGALQKVKDSGYRTIVVAMEFPDDELQLIADAAEELEMNKGEYLWIWNEMFEPSLTHGNNTNMTKLLAGSALLMPYSESFLDPETDPFARAWYSQGEDAVDRLNAANPIAPGEPGYIFAENDWFQTVQLEWGSDFLYDAVMAIGIGACLAEQTSNETIISSADHQRSIRQVAFTGVTGPIAFGGEGEDEAGGRDPVTVSWAEINVLPPQQEGNETVYFQVSGIYTPEDQHWHHIAPFVYRDGRTVPPELLRDEPDYNFLSSWLRILGYTLMGITVFGAIVCALWVFVRRKHRVVRASQPEFLYLIAFGAAVECSTILTISNDESYGWSTESLSRACMANPWLLSTGHIIIYSALFTKLWRVNKVLQFSRRTIEVRHVVGPMIAIVSMALLVLSLWTALDPLIWMRVEIDPVSGDSIGQCSSERFAAFIIPLIVLMLIPTVLTALMAWKTMDVDEAYAESRYIFSMILVQLEVVVLSVPLVFILRDVSTDGRYLGFLLLLWVFPMSTLLFIFLPKYVAFRRHNTANSSAARSTIRGQRQGVKITGSSAASAASVKRSRPPSSLEETFISEEREETTKTSGVENGVSEGAIPEEAPRGGTEDAEPRVSPPNPQASKTQLENGAELGGIDMIGADDTPSCDVFEDDTSDASGNGMP